MQTASKPERKQAASSTKKTREPEKIAYFSFAGALPEGHTLVLNLALGTLSELAICESGPRLLTQQQFTTSELSLLVPLLESYPYFCPYELMFARFYNGEVTEEILEQCRRRLQVALAHAKNRRLKRASHRWLFLSREAQFSNSSSICCYTSISASRKAIACFVSGHQLLHPLRSRRRQAVLDTATPLLTTVSTGEMI